MKNFPLKNPLEYAYVSTEEQVEQDENQKKVIATLKDWDLWYVLCLHSCSKHNSGNYMDLITMMLLCFEFQLHNTFEIGARL